MRPNVQFNPFISVANLFLITKFFLNKVLINFLLEYFKEVVMVQGSIKITVVYIKRVCVRVIVFPN